MSTDTGVARTRRAFLAAAGGAAAATVVSAFERPSTALAGTDGDVVLGAENVAAATTTVTYRNDSQVLGGCALHGVCDPAHRGAIAILGEAAVGIGVGGDSQEGEGVKGRSHSGFGVSGESGTGRGVLGYSGTFPGYYYAATSGVHGYAAQDANARGVHGQTTVGQGVRGEATSGVGVYATADTGAALKVLGKVALSRSGKASIAPGRSKADVDLRSRGGLVGTPLCFANLMSYRSGVYVAAVRPNYPSAGQLRIYLNKTVTSTTPVAWVVLN